LWYLLARHSTISFKTVRHKFHTSFIRWCLRPSWPWVVAYADTSFTKTSSPTGNRTTVYCLLTTDFTQSAVGLLPRKVSIVMYDLWSSAVTVPEALADAISNTRQFKTAYTREVTNTRAASSSLQLQLASLSLGLHHPLRSAATLCIIYEMTFVDWRLLSL
jgi:hypothetical protein